MTWFRVLMAFIGGILFGFVIGVLSAPHAKAQSWWDIPAVRACCSIADAVYADEYKTLPDKSIHVTVTGGGPRSHVWAPVGRVYIIPADKERFEPGNPTGRALLFLNPANLDHVFCFFTGPLI